MIIPDANLVAHACDSGSRRHEAARAHVRTWLARPNAIVVHPGARHPDLLFQLLEAAGTGGNLTTDGRLAALAVEHQAELHSTDADMARFPGLRWVNPLL